MTAIEIVRQVQEDASEWLEMTTNPDEMIIGILANKVAALQNEIKYLEKRLQNVSRNTPTI